MTSEIQDTAVHLLAADLSRTACRLPASPV